MSQISGRLFVVLDVQDKQCGFFAHCHIHKPKLEAQCVACMTVAATAWNLAAVAYRMDVENTYVLSHDYTSFQFLVVTHWNSTRMRGEGGREHRKFGIKQ